VRLPILRSAVGRWSDTAVITATIAAVAVLGLASFACIYGTSVGGNLYDENPIRSDGVGYYLYLPAVLLDHDVTMERTAARSFDGRETEMAGVRRVPPHNHYLDQFPIGEAVMMLPLFGIGHAVAVSGDSRENGFSLPYQVAAAAAGFSYLLVGLVFLASSLRRWFSRGTVVVTLLAITFGTDLFDFGTLDATFSHAFSFAVVALIVRLTVAIWETPRPATALGLGAALGLLALVRPSDLVVLVFCTLVGVDGAQSLRRRAVGLVRHAELVALGAGVFVLVLLPQLAYWYAITGKVYVHAYESDARLDLLHPHLIGVLFSVRKGLFFWTPLLLLAVAGLPLLRRSAPALFYPSVAYLVVETWVVSSWSYWWYGDSFGMRPFVEALPIMALGFAALVEGARAAAARWVVRPAIVVTTALAVHAMLAYWTQNIPYDGTTLHQYLASFRHL
jgi:hypothetical protein